MNGTPAPAAATPSKRLGPACPVIVDASASWAESESFGRGVMWWATWLATERLRRTATAARRRENRVSWTLALRRLLRGLELLGDLAVPVVAEAVEALLEHRDRLVGAAAAVERDALLEQR